MNRDDHSSIPDELRDRFEQESSDEQNELGRVWHILGDAGWSYDDAPPADETWSAVQERIDAAGAREDRPRRQPRPRRHSWQRWGAVAASILVVMLAGALFWKQPVDVTALPGEHVTVTLPDGSSAELNSETTLSYPRGFSAWPFIPAERRVVQLQGEAFFDVREGERPFVVETFNARVEVLGTTFNVRARADAETGETHVTLAAGRVRVRAAEQPDRAVLLSEAGQSSRVTTTVSSPTEPQPVAVDRATAWRQQGFAVSDWPLSAVFAELERRYDMRISVRAPEVLTDSMTLYYPQHADADTIIHDIAVAQGLTYRATSRGYEIMSK